MSSVWAWPQAGQVTVLEVNQQFEDDIATTGYEYVGRGVPAGSTSCPPPFAIRRATP